MRGCKPLPLLHSGVTDRITKFLHDVARLSQIDLFKSEVRYYNPFSNDKAMNEVESADFANFNIKIGCHGTVP